MNIFTNAQDFKLGYRALILTGLLIEKTISN